MLVFFLVLFFVFESLNISPFDQKRFLSAGGWLPAAIGMALLCVDVFIPIPSSLVMVSLGIAYGWLWGALLSVAGSLAAAWVGYAVGRRSRWLVERLISPEEARRADRMLQRWGVLAIVVSRPLPMVAETVAILAGSSAVGWGRLTLAALAGSLPIAFFCAWAGATAQEMESCLWAFLLTLAVAALIWLVGWLVSRRRASRTTDKD
jgi:uncharacterized membrane protein YdjX (TVP38/TMEM64 family)